MANSGRVGARCITATFEIVTPMFLGGAKHEASHIRGSAVKGALAFWWRALNFARFVKGAGGNTAKALRKMRQRERELFGAGGEKGGLGAFLLRVRHGKPDFVQQGRILGQNGKEGDPAVGVGARYLGYGLMDAFDGKNTKSGRLCRSCIQAGLIFHVDLIFRKNATDDMLAELKQALQLLGLLGGLGARVRRGWGSVALVSLKGDVAEEISIPSSKKEYIGQVRKLLNSVGHGRRGRDWPLSAFADESRIWCQQDLADTPLNALDSLGRAFLNYRANGRARDRDVGGQSILKQFREDHDWFRQGANDVDIPYRTAFGLPHMYNSQQGYGVTPAGDTDRRASPLMMHIHKTSEGSFGVLVYMPTRFLDGRVSAIRPRGGDTTRAYDLQAAYGARNASGDDVIKSFVGESEKFRKNTVMNFVSVLS